MSLEKSLRKALTLNSTLKKGEDPEAYKKLASTGFLLAHPVKIKGESHRKDNGIGYHASIKFFDKENDSPDEAHKAASKLEMHPPNPKEVGIEPKVLKDRNGNDVYALGLTGKHADKLKEHHEKFGHMGHKENYKWGAHISVPKAIHDEVKTAGHKTAHDAGIEFGHAELKRGPKTLQTYKHDKMGKSEKIEEIKLPSKLNIEKGEKDISEKTLSEIQKDTAWTWAARAAACYERLEKTGEQKWKNDAEEYRHEAVEHAALIGDKEPHVLKEIHSALEKYRKISDKELEKTEPLLKPWSSQAQAAWGHSPEGKEALGGEAAVKEWDRATKGKHLPRHVKKSEDLIPAPNTNTYKELDLHHGTKSKTPFENFDMKHHASGFYPGIYTSSDSKETEKHGSPVKVKFKGHLFDIKDSKHADQLHSHVGGGGGGHPLVQKLKAAGYHGIKRGNEHIIFDPEHAKIAKSEDLQKGALKNLLTAGAMAGALASPSHAANTPKAPEPSRAPASISAPQNSGYSRDKMMNAISQVESSGGKNLAHKPTSHGTAYGKFAEMPDMIRETIKLNPDLKRQHQKALGLQGNDLTHYMQDNPKLENELADRHLKRLEHHFGQDPDKIAFSWNQGISGTNKALKQKTDIGSHPYVQKFKQAYERGK